MKYDEGMRGIDYGEDIHRGDIVLIKLMVLEEPTPSGGVRLQFLARNGKKEYGAERIAAVFIKRPSNRLIKAIWNFISRWF
jgi:hypothetical protein